MFDGDSSTDVVCEGYSKAFQFLCDNSRFSGGVACYIMTGMMSSGSGGGLHMWNNVLMDNGRVYMVDVTNSDDGTIGANDPLFLVGADGGSLKDGYVFNVSGYPVKYKYDSDTRSTFPERLLTVSSKDYTLEANLTPAPTAKPTPKPTPRPTPV